MSFAYFRIRLKYGFSLVELLIVMTIVMLIALGGFMIGSQQIDSANAAKAAKMIQEVNQAIQTYRADVAEWPPSYRRTGSDATQPLNANTLKYLPTDANDALYWRGPYLPNYPEIHPWKGQVGYGLTGTEYFIYLDDDRPGFGTNDNAGAIPTRILKMIDKSLDDGDLATGDVRGDNLGFGATFGEIAVRVY